MHVVYTLVVPLTLCITMIYFSSAKLKTLWRRGHGLFGFAFLKLTKGPGTRQVLHNYYFGGGGMGIDKWNEKEVELLDRYGA